MEHTERIGLNVCDISLSTIKVKQNTVIKNKQGPDFKYCNTSTSFQSLLTLWEIERFSFACWWVLTAAATVLRGECCGLGFSFTSVTRAYPKSPIPAFNIPCGAVKLLGGQMCTDVYNEHPRILVTRNSEQSLHWKFGLGGVEVRLCLLRGKGPRSVSEEFYFTVFV